jgi:hypothetical protein
MVSSLLELENFLKGEWKEGMGTILSSVLGLPAYIAGKILDWVAGKQICKYCEDHISSKVCHLDSDGKEVWWDGKGWIADLIIACVAVTVFLLIFGADIFIFLKDLGMIGDFLLAVLKILDWPFKTAFWLIEEAFRYFFVVAKWVASTTNTAVELWYLISGTLIALILTEFGLEISRSYWKISNDAYIWRIFHFLNTPLVWVYDLWTEQLFTSEYNPLKYLIYIPAIPAEFFVIALSSILNVLNPLYWWDKLKSYWQNKK